MGSQCPKCHRPLDEDYVCCAGIEFQWKCTQCHKRSRGFALPFGQCPLCGGKTERIDEFELPTNGNVLLLQQAVEIEISSYHFYRRLAESVDDPETSDFFESLSKMEKEHADELAEKYHLDLGEEIFESTDHPLPEPFFKDLCCFEDTGDIKGLYDCAIKLEKRTFDFFSKKADEMPKGTERDLYLELAAEESEHIAILETQRDR